MVLAHLAGLHTLCPVDVVSAGGLLQHRGSGAGTACERPVTQLITHHYRYRYCYLDRGGPYKTGACHMGTPHPPTRLCKWRRRSHPAIRPAASTLADAPALPLGAHQRSSRYPTQPRRIRPYYPPPSPTDTGPCIHQPLPPTYGSGHRRRRASKGPVQGT